MLTTNAVILYKYLCAYSKNKKDWFECPTDGEIKHSIGLKRYEIQHALNQLIKQKYIEKDNPVYISLTNNECPHITRRIKIL